MKKYFILPKVAPEKIFKDSPLLIDSTNQAVTPSSLKIIFSSVDLKSGSKICFIAMDIQTLFPLPSFSLVALQFWQLFHIRIPGSLLR
jgi:hypothetical protein